MTTPLMVNDWNGRQVLKEIYNDNSRGKSNLKLLFKETTVENIRLFEKITFLFIARVHAIT